jgi:hypothetical protein
MQKVKSIFWDEKAARVERSQAGRQNESHLSSDANALRNQRRVVWYKIV